VLLSAYWLSLKTPEVVWVIIRDYGRDAGLVAASYPHMLRHACGYAFADQGADTRPIQD
jgi:type 1 fimbriae regulatory protein FimB